MKHTLLLALLLGRCDASSVRPCTNIPDGGCPLAYGQSCKDPACAAIYACLPGNQWELRGTCPPHDASAMDAGAEAAPKDASIDAREVRREVERGLAAAGGAVPRQIVRGCEV